MEKEKEKKKATEKPVVDDPKDTGAGAITDHDKAQGPKAVRITGLDQPLHEKEDPTRGKGPEVVEPTGPAQVDAPTQTVQVTSDGGSGTTVGGAGCASGVGGAKPHTPIVPKDTLGDIYYKSYTKEARGDALHRAPWNLKQKDTFLEFSTCHEWSLNSFTPGEVVRHRSRTHDGLYQAYVVGEANTRAANHQIVREWRTMVRERSDWENYRDCLLREAKDFEKLKAAFVEEKTEFEADRKSEEWGREGLRGKLRAAEE
ncbi:hypothetical protein Hdeb2414_s0242g00845361 [Helianthus debilis subsp. tardiflorus]